MKTLTEIHDICFGCMHNKGRAEVCPQCGWIDGTKQEFPQHLSPGTILQNKYVVGKVLGQGGFGITYLGWDLQLDMKLAIKEYMPKDFATRSTGQHHITCFSGDYKSHFDHGMKKFIEEAKILAKYSNHAGIVPVRDYFEENNTAYLVMYYLEGIDLKRYLEQLGGKLPYEQAIHILMPVMDALKEIHKDGLLHRDISPDNIYITTEGEIKLLDFGAARHALNDHNRSLSVILKPGYAPEEQYRTKGRQGPWTDVYAVAATFYKMIVGQIPPESLDRLEVDTLIKPSNLGISLPPHVENALIKALSVKGQDRYQSIGEFQQSLLNQSSSTSYYSNHSQQPTPQSYQQSYNQILPSQPQPKKSKTALIIGITVGGVLLSVVSLFLIGMFIFSPDDKNQAQQPKLETTKTTEDTTPDEQVEPKTEVEIEEEDPVEESVLVVVPRLYNLTEQEAIAALEAVGLKANIIKQENLITYQDRVFDQGVLPDTQTDSKNPVNVFVNTGVELPVDLNTVFSQQMTIINQYWDEAALIYKEKRTEEALRVYTQAYVMATELFQHNGSLDAQFAQGSILSHMSLLKSQLGYPYYALESSLDAVKILEDLRSKAPQVNKVSFISAYSNLAWHHMLNNQPAQAIPAAESALSFDSNHTLSKISLAHGYLFTNSFDTAMPIYLEVKDLEVNGVLAKNIILDDFNKLTQVGYPTDMMEEAKRFLNAEQ